MPESSQEVTALAEIKPFDIAALITPPTAEEAAPETEPEAEETTGQTEEAEAEETGSMEILNNITGPRRKESATVWLRYI